MTLNSRLFPGSLPALAFILATSAAAGTVLADDDGQQLMNIAHPAYRSECGSCHIAFPPSLLTANSWRAVMTGLDKHFGSDASLDADTARDITNFLVANAGRRDTSSADGKPLLRITETRWFRKEHRDGHDGITPGVFRSAAVKSAANCSACHRDAEQGDYSEDRIRIPANGARS